MGFDLGGEALDRARTQGQARREGTSDRRGLRGRVGQGTASVLGGGEPVGFSVTWAKVHDRSAPDLQPKAPMNREVLFDGETTDQALVERFQTSGDRAAFEELVRRHRDRVYGLALRMMKNEDEALDIVQETFLSAFRKLPEFRGDSQFGSWVYRIAANFALMRIRHKKVVDQVQEPMDGLGDRFKEDGRWAIFPTGLWARRGDDALLDSELRQKLIQAVEGLPEMHRAVFMLRDVEGLSYDEIAKTLETTVSAIKSRLHRARLALRQELQDYFEGKEG